jgi:hypothetical protein
MNRRRLLILLGTGAAAVAGSLKLSFFSNSKKREMASLLVAGDRTPGRLSDSGVRTLIAMAEALAGRQNLRGNYFNFYCWRSEHLPGYRDRYERFASLLRLESRHRMNRDFCDLSLEVRLTVVNSLRPLLLKKNESSAQGLAEFERPVIQETLHLYARTDAWFALGYDSFPGEARGFATYQSLPA